MQPLSLQNRIGGGGGGTPPIIGLRYAVARMLGKGAQARVYLAWDRDTHGWVALKVLATQYLEDDEIRQRFVAEATTMKRLQHPHILRVLDTGHEGPVPWMALELARGGAVTRWIRRNGPMSPAIATAVAVQSAQGLHVAHQNGIIHRDVKPHNLLIADAQRIVLTDFGVARDADASMTATGTVMGTFAYMAPEQRNDAKSVDQRADVYSLASTLYSLMTGRPSAELFYAREDDDLLASIPPVLRPVLIKGAAYKRDDRYPDMASFGMALQEVQAQLPPIPSTANLADDWLDLPAGPPTQVEAGALDDLRGDLGLSEEQPTHIPAAKADLQRIFEAQQTALYHDTSTNLGFDEAPTVRILPGESNAYLEEAGLAEPVSTMRPAPSTKLHVTPEEEAAEDDGPPVVRMVAITAALGMVFALTVWGAAVGTNVWRSMSVSSAASDLVATVATAETSVAALADAGADAAPLQRLYANYESSSAPGDALAFAKALSTTADEVKADDLARSRMAPLLDAADAYESAVKAKKEHDRSFLGMLSLGIGR